MNKRLDTLAKLKLLILAYAVAFAIVLVGFSKAIRDDVAANRANPKALHKEARLAYARHLRGDCSHVINVATFAGLEGGRITDSTLAAR